MKIHGVASMDAASSLRGLPRIAIDLGFSGKSRSSGFAAKGFDVSVGPANLLFAECAQAVSDLSGRAKELVLILEAPLSSAFDLRGNPQARGDFEAKPRVRWWSLGAGAAMALSAQHFLRRVAAAGTSSCVVHLVEAFVAGSESGIHAEVAERVLKGFDSNVPARWHQPMGATVESVTAWLPGQVDRQVPVVLLPTSPR